jgi:hypothetical protein
MFRKKNPESLEELREYLFHSAITIKKLQLVLLSAMTAISSDTICLTNGSKMWRVVPKCDEWFRSVTNGSDIPKFVQSVTNVPKNDEAQITFTFSDWLKIPMWLT